MSHHRSISLVNHFILALSIAGALAMAAALPSSTRGQVQVGIQIGAPPPPPVLVGPPQFVVVPTTPAVQYVPDFALNIFLYGGRYYAWNDGAWFVTASVGQPWTYIERARVPHAVLVVPARYYKLPPGQAKKLYRQSGHGRHHKGHHHGDEDD